MPISIVAARPAPPEPDDGPGRGKHGVLVRTQHHQRRPSPCQRPLALARIGEIIANITDRMVAVRVALALTGDWLTQGEVVAIVRGSAAWSASDAHVWRDVRNVVDRLTDQHVVERDGDNVRMLAIEARGTATPRAFRYKLNVNW